MTPFVAVLHSCAIQHVLRLPCMERTNSVIFVTLVASIAVSGCTKMNDHSVTPPQLNPHPVQRVQLYVQAPPDLKVRVGADYRIGFWLGMLGGGGEYCGPDVDAPPNAIVHERPGITVPIELKWDGSGYQGEFFLDHFLPGRCHWRFLALDTLSPAKDSVSTYFEFAPNYNFDTSHSRGVYDQSAAQDTDLWCGHDPSPNVGERGKPLCTSLDYFVLYPGTVSNELLATIPVDRRDRKPSVNIYPFTKSVTLRYHDLEAENRAAAKFGALAPADADRVCDHRGVRIYIDREGSLIVNGIAVDPGDTAGLVQRVVQRVRNMDSTPKIACFANATPPAKLPSTAAMMAIEAVAELRLPLVVYTDGTFVNPVQLN